MVEAFVASLKETERFPGAAADTFTSGAGAAVGLAVESGRLVIEPAPGPRYTLEELLAASDYTTPQPAEEREWIDAPAVGREEI